MKTDWFDSCYGYHCRYLIGVQVEMRFYVPPLPADEVEGDEATRQERGVVLFHQQIQEKCRRSGLQVTVPSTRLQGVFEFTVCHRKRALRRSLKFCSFRLEDVTKLKCLAAI